MWSALVVIFTLITGEMPFFSESRKELMNQIVNKDIDFLISEYTFDDDLRSFFMTGF